MARGASLGVVGKIGGRGIHVLTQVVLARSLGPASYGVYAIGWTIFRLGTLLGAVGLDRGVLRFAAGAEKVEATSRTGTGRAWVVRDAVFMGFFAAAAVAATLTFLGPTLVDSWFRKPEVASVLVWFSIAVAFASLLRVLVAATWTTGTVVYGVICEDLLQPGLNLGLIVLALVAGWGLRGVSQAVLISVALSSLLALYFVGRLFGWSPPDVADRQHGRPELLRFSMTAGAAAALPVFLTWTDRVLVGALRPAAEMGIYQAASQIPVVFSLVLSGITGSVFGSLVAHLHAQGERERVSALFRFATRWGIYVSAPILIVLVVLSREVVILLYGGDYAGGQLPLLILAFGGFMNAATGPVGLLLVMVGRERAWLIASSLALILDVVLQLVLTPRLGLPGAALATVLSLGCAFGLGLILARKLGYWPYDSLSWRALLALLAVGGLAWALHDMAGSGSTAGIVLTLGVVGIGYPFAVMRMGMDGEDLRMLRSPMRKLRLEWVLPK